MAIRSKDDAEQLRERARSMYFSNETVDWFLGSASAAQLRAVMDLLEYELDVREHNKRARLYRRARFPQVKSFEGYDFSEVGMPDGYTEDDLKSLSFVDAAQDFVFYGQTGRGKTHLAIAIGNAWSRPARRFASTRPPSSRWRWAGPTASTRWRRACGTSRKNDLIILDEFGYVPLDAESARLLFQVMSDCHEKRSLVITTNIEFSKWGTVLGDDKMAGALIDRIVHHGRLIEFTGASRRMEASLMLGKAKS